MSEIRKCYRCNDEYIGSVCNWGIEIKEGIYVCLYCEYNQHERKWKPEWETM
jgi:hypothetical protein